jgi:hypothetical protein
MAGWPKATGVLVRHERLWAIAREVQSAPLPEAASAELAVKLFEAARNAGLTFSEDQRATYRRAGMKLKAAGALVEAAICALASDAAYTPPKQDSDAPRASALVQALMRIAAPA